MKKKELEKKLAYLETVQDHLITELEYLDCLMKKIGFIEGLLTVKATAEEITYQKNLLS